LMTDPTHPLADAQHSGWSVCRPGRRGATPIHLAGGILEYEQDGIVSSPTWVGQRQPIATPAAPGSTANEVNPSVRACDRRRPAPRTRCDVRR
jgi:hypothetical protein